MADTAHKIALVEDNVTVRSLLERAIAEQPELRWVGSAGTCAEARQLLALESPDVILIDLGLPDGSGLDLIREIARDTPSTRILVSTVFGDERTVIDAVSAGATGYLLKNTPPAQVLDSIRQVLAGGSPISPTAAHFVLKRLQDSAALREAEPPESPLSPRETEVLQLVAKGFSYSEVAEMKELSVNTVACHIKRIYQKLAVHSRAEAVFEAAELGLISVGKGRPN